MIEKVQDTSPGELIRTALKTSSALQPASQSPPNQEPLVWTTLTPRNTAAHVLENPPWEQNVLCLFLSIQPVPSTETVALRASRLACAGVD